MFFSIWVDVSVAFEEFYGFDDWHHQKAQYIPGGLKKVSSHLISVFYTNIFPQTIVFVFISATL